MKNRFWRIRYGLLLTAAASLNVLNGCFLSDQQLSSVWQSVITSALNTIVTNTIAAGA